MNNKGLSNIIATVLIVLLALAAVAIVWTVMNGLIGDTSGQIELTNLCVLSEAKPISCDTLTTDTDISVQLVRGENVLSTDAKAGVREVVAVVTFKDGTIETLEEIAPSKSGFASISMPRGVADFAKAAVVVQDAKGNTKTCDESAARVPCT